MIARTVVVLSVVSAALPFSQSASAGVFPVTPAVETEPVAHSGDSADDAKIWLHPTDPNRSVIIGTDKHDTEGGLALYDLAGRLIYFAKDGKLNNVDVRYNFPLAGAKTDIIASGNRSDNTIAVYTIDPNSRTLTDLTARSISIGITEAYGFCLYQSWRTGAYYAFVNDKNGDVEQWRLFDNGSAKIDAVRVRAFDVGGQTEGMAADDQLGWLYVGEEDVGIWKYPAEPTEPADNASRFLVDTTKPDAGGRLVADVEGLTIYYGHGTRGYLIASSQGEDDSDHPLAHTFAVYHRTGRNQHVMSFEISGNAERGIDHVSNTDGIGVTSASLGPAFPAGLFVAQDGHNSGGNQNFKLVPWEKIAAAVTPPLVINNQWNPRDLPENRTWRRISLITDIAEFSANWLIATHLHDTNNDHLVNFHDLLALCSNWLTTAKSQTTDFNADSAFDFRDFALLAAQWRRACPCLPDDSNKDCRVDFHDFVQLAQLAQLPPALNMTPFPNSY
ncbi:MAG: phytase [Phycisphaerales bacterium]|nr:MAG: phytase [Phycisphaerales bacterium]